ncbi:MAG: DUF5011 domain-containing protein, partial [Mariprofundaceae bacterium]
MIPALLAICMLLPASAVAVDFDNDGFYDAAETALGFNTATSEGVTLGQARSLSHYHNSAVEDAAGNVHIFSRGRYQMRSPTAVLIDDSSFPISEFPDPLYNPTTGLITVVGGNSCDFTVIDPSLDDQNGGRVDAAAITTITPTWAEAGNHCAAAMDSSGNIHIVGDGGGGIPLNYVKWSSAGVLLSGPTRLDVLGDSVQRHKSADIEVDSVGNAHVIWVDGHGTSGHPRYSKIDTAGNVVIANLLLSTTWVNRGGIAIDASDIVHTIYDGNYFKFDSTLYDALNTDAQNVTAMTIIAETALTLLSNGVNFHINWGADGNLHMLSDNANNSGGGNWFDTAINPATGAIVSDTALSTGGSWTNGQFETNKPSANWAIWGEVIGVFPNPTSQPIKSRHMTTGAALSAPATASAGNYLETRRLTWQDLPYDAIITAPLGLDPLHITIVAVEGLTAPGDPATITIPYPANIPAAGTFQTWDTTNGWQAMTFASDDGDHILTMTATDGGAGDADAVADSQLAFMGSPTKGTADTVGPAILLLGANPMYVVLNGTYVEPGATVIDNVDGDISASIVIAGTVDTATIGTYTLTYDAAADAAGNATTQVTRSVIVRNAPVLTMLGNTPQDVLQNAAYTDAGATASDEYAFPTDISANIVTGGTFVDTTTLGTFTMTYDVSNIHGLPAPTLTRDINVILADVTPPVISLGIVPTQVLQNAAINLLAGVTALDNIDGDISANIAVAGTFANTATLGSYTIAYDVSDAATNAATTVTRPIEVIAADTVPPVITMLGISPVIVAQNAAYIDAGATAFDTVDGDITANIGVGGTFVNTATLGSFTFTYVVSDAAVNTATIVTRTINVVDVTPPVITMLGNTPISVVKGGVYVDAGATALDDTDGDITANIAMGGTFSGTNTVGAFTITYDVSDAATNAATTVTRDINVTAPVVIAVVDRTPPVITAPADLLIAAIDFNGVPATDSAIVAFLAAATATDAASGTRTVTHDAPTIFPVGSTLVTFTAKDARGNTATSTATVTVSGTSLAAALAPTDGAADKDGDGISDGDEHILGTDAENSDTDGDGSLDGDEIGDVTNPMDSDNDSIFDANESPETTNDATRATGVASSNRSTTFSLSTDGQNLSG